MNPAIHFEMPAEDRSRMRRFYETTFGCSEGNRVSIMQPNESWKNKAK